MASSAESVWKALTNAEELKRWFPLEARAEPGKGGKIRLFAAGNLLPGKRYSFEVATDEVWSGRVEFIVRNRGFCVTVDSLNDALAWLTIEGSGPVHDAQFRFSTHGLPQPQVTTLESR